MQLQNMQRILDHLFNMSMIILIILFFYIITSKNYILLLTFFPIFSAIRCSVPFVINFFEYESVETVIYNERKPKIVISEVKKSSPLPLDVKEPINLSFIEFQNDIIKYVIIPFGTEKDNYSENDGSFMLSQSFLFENNFYPVYNRKNKKELLSSFLRREMNEELIEIIIRIGMHGILFYRIENKLHRKAMFLLISNYLNFLVPSFQKYQNSMTDKNKYIGISIQNDNLYDFYLGDFVYKKNGDPLLAYYYFFKHIKEYCKGWFGNVCLMEYEFMQSF